MLIRRSAFVVFKLEETEQVDLAHLLRGTITAKSIVQWIAIPLSAAGNRLVVDSDSLAALHRLPLSWITFEEAERKTGLERALLSGWVDRGLLISDSPSQGEQTIRLREERLRDGGWSPEAAFLHYSSVRRFARVRDEPLESPPLVNDPLALQAFVLEHGVPPTEHYSRSSDYVQLPSAKEVSRLEEVLHQRQTIRAFDQSAALPLATLSRVLRGTFGFHGVSDLGSGLKLLKRTSPSGGSLHPIEAYVMARHVDGLAPAIYHYDSFQHGLAHLGRFEMQDLEHLAKVFCDGQRYGAEAHALIILTARFNREFWKYRQVERAYSVVMMDAGHLSQTFYLLATESNLGVFVTAAINLEAITEQLCLNDPNEAPIAILGCGPADLNSDESSLARTALPLSTGLT